MSLKLNERGRKCGFCGNYDDKKEKCLLFKRKLSPDYYCVVDGNNVFFINSH